MKRINPKDDFGKEFFDVGDENFVNLIINRINIEGNKEIELSFQGCITNYPATVLTPQIAGHNLKNKLGLIKFGNYDNSKTKIYT